MLKTLSGLPGVGKTELLTLDCLDYYRKQNTFIKRYIRKLRHKEIYVNNVFSNYPVCLDLKNNIYSNECHINDLTNSWRFPFNSFIAIDEPQLDYDSMETKEFPREIGAFLQLHRHFFIHNVEFATQHPNRLVVYEKNIMNVYDRIIWVKRIPFTPFAVARIRSCFEINDYDFINTRSKDIKKQHNIKGRFKFYNYKKVFKSYDTHYLSPLNLDKPLINKGTYNSLYMSDRQKHLYLDRFEDFRLKRLKNLK